MNSLRKVLASLVWRSLISLFVISCDLCFMCLSSQIDVLFLKTSEHCSKHSFEPSDLLPLPNLSIWCSEVKVCCSWLIPFVSSLLEEILFLSSQESSSLPHHSSASLYMKIPDFGDGGFWWFSFSVHFLVRPKRTLYSKKYGVDLIRYTHAANTVVYSSNKIDGKQAFFLGSYGHGFFC